MRDAGIITGVRRGSAPLALLALLTLSAAPSRAAAAQRTVVVGIYENEPKVFTSPAGKPAGIFVDVIEDVARAEGWQLRYVNGTWAEGLDRLRRGVLDLMPDVAYTPERDQIFAFHQVPVLSVWSQVYAPRGSRIASILDLNGKRVGVLEQTIQRESFARLASSFGLKITLVDVHDYGAEFDLLERGALDAGITNRLYGLVHARQHGLQDTPIMFDPSPFFFAAPREGRRDLLEAIDRHLITWKRDPGSVYYATLRRWTSEEVPFQFPAWAWTLAIAVGGVVLLSVAGSVVLKHQVNVRTCELRALNYEMEQRIVLRTTELAEAMEQARAADRTKSAFLATMSHELRTPLNSIIGFTGILLQELAGPLNEEQHKQLGMVNASAKHLLELIRDVLDISKIEAGQLRIAREPFDVRASLEKLVQGIQPLTERKGLRLAAELAPDLGTMVSDQRRFEQILLNLLYNAVKFTESGSIQVRCRRDGARVIAEVEDTGIGIKPEDLGKLFGAFRQIDSAITRKYEGTGLGLAISRKLAQALGGDITVTSTWGKGSVFRVEVAAEAPAAATPSAA